jgi:hypothetical protein
MALSPELPAFFPASVELPESSTHVEREYLFKQAVEVDMNNTSSISVQQNVLAMSIPESTMRNLEFIHDDWWPRTPR